MNQLIRNYCRSVCKGKCCKPNCQDFTQCDNELCISFTCSKVWKVLNLSDEEIKELRDYKRKIRDKYRKIYNVRNPYFVNVRERGGKIES
jgi:hypothetical protein